MIIVAVCCLHDLAILPNDGNIEESPCELLMPFPQNDNPQDADGSNKMVESESTFSLSAATKTDDIEEIVGDLSNAEIFKRIEEIEHVNDILQSETSMFEKFFRRVEPKESPLAASQSNTRQSQSQEPLFMRGRKRVTKFTKTSDTELLLLNPEQKCDIAQRELEELKDELEKFRVESSKVLDNYRAGIEESEVCLEELKKSTYEFEREICKGAIHARRKAVMAERVVHYFNEKIRMMDTFIDKLKLKNGTLKLKRRRIIRQLKQKEEMGEILHEVDFQQLKIENAQYLEKIDEKNKDLLRLKLMAANTQSVLTHHRRKLVFLTSDLARINDEIRVKESIMERFLKEEEIVENEHSEVEKLNMELRKSLADYRVPANQVYVEGKAYLRELHTVVRNWERKVDIVQMALKNHKKAWQEIWSETQHGAAWLKAKRTSNQPTTTA